MMPSRALLSALFACLLAGPTALRAGLTEVELAEGGLLRGTLLAERPDRVVLDLGYSVVTVPREAILALREVADEGQAADAPQAAGELYRVGRGGATQSVKEWVGELGEAVVLIRTGIGLGSGFVIHPEGYVVTNDHVISGDNEITVTVWEQGAGGELQRLNFNRVRVVANSPEIDLALLKVEDGGGRTFKTVSLGESAAVRQGQPVFAIGSPLGLERSVSEGIVALRNRNIGGRLLLQTTAQISPGNSGGPLFNLQGQVIGVNRLKVVAMGAEGLGFAIPSHDLRLFLDNRDAFAFDPLNPNNGYRYNRPPTPAAYAEAQAREEAPR